MQEKKPTTIVINLLAPTGSDRTGSADSLFLTMEGLGLSCKQVGSWIERTTLAVVAKYYKNTDYIVVDGFPLSSENQTAMTHYRRQGILHLHFWLAAEETAEDQLSQFYAGQGLTLIRVPPGTHENRTAFVIRYIEAYLNDADIVIRNDAPPESRQSEPSQATAGREENEASRLAAHRLDRQAYEEGLMGKVRRH